jgi:predicted heme/steroid binding protein
MVSTALFAVFFLGPRLKKRKASSPEKIKNRLTVDELKFFDGAAGRPAYFGFRGKAYDVTQSKSWGNGLHFGRHRAGEDLTDFLEQAPHGEEKILDMPEVGELRLAPVSRTVYENIFYFFANFNLVAVLLIILILALWRWW